MNSWSRLAALTGESPDSIAKKRLPRQAQVEHIRGSVRQRPARLSGT
ncbi:MAG: hypothetical protein U0903_22630 [Planctomycetales bacterium]